MASASGDSLDLELDHTGERLSLRRIRQADGTSVLEIKSSLAPHSEGPPLHIHHHEAETGRVVAGVLSASVDGRLLKVNAGDSATFPRGSVHRWWNDGDETLLLEGMATPVVDLDRYLQAIFEVANAGIDGRPPWFYLAHVARRHRVTQEVLLLPRPVQRVLFPLLVLLGSVLGKYRGSTWPGYPPRCSGAPEIAAEDA